MKFPGRRWLLVILAIGAAGCDSGSGPDPAVKVVPLSSPAGPGTLAPRLAVGSDGRIVMSWLADGGSDDTRLRYARFREGGWSSAQTAARGENWFVNWADTPSVVPLPDGRLAAHWLAKSADATYAYDVVMSVADGDGRWGAPFRPHADGTPTEHGFVSLVPTRSGHVRALWLDGRYTGEFGPGPGRSMPAMTLRSAVVDDGGRRDEGTEVDGMVCDCCATALAKTADGHLAVYRDRTEDEIRDIYAARLTDAGWQTPVPVHRDGWRIGGCPVNGPAVASRGDEVVVAWFTAADGVPAVKMARSKDGGKSFGEPVRLDRGRPTGRVDVILEPDGRAMVTWIGQPDGRTGIYLARIGANDEATPPVRLVDTRSARASGFPKLVSTGSGYLLAWTDPSAERVETVLLTNRD